MYDFSNCITSIPQPLSLVANTYTNLVRSNPRRVGIIIPTFGGVTINIDYAEPGSAQDGFQFTNPTSPIVIHKMFWGDIVTRNISIKSSAAITLRILEVIDPSMKV